MFTNLKASRQMLIKTCLHKSLASLPNLLRNLLLNLKSSRRILTNPNQIPNHDARYEFPRIARIRVLIKAQLRRRNRKERRLIRPLLPKRRIRPPLHVRFLHQHQILEIQPLFLQEGIRKAYILARVFGTRLHNDLVFGDAHLAGNGGEDHGLGLVEETLCQGARFARVDEIGCQAVEVELRGVGGDARIEAAEAEDGVGGVEGHVHAVVVVDEGGVLVDLVGIFYSHDEVVFFLLLFLLMNLHV